jgi:lipopolysaccharide export system permease protein
MMIRHHRAQFGIIHRYVLKEFLLSFFIAFLFFFFIFFVNQLLLLAEEILSKRVSPGKVARLILYSLPAILAFTFPFSSLLGALMAIGRLSSDNEIKALRASGVSHGRLFIPVLFLGIMLTGFSFFTNDFLLPRGTINFARLYRDILYTNPALELETNSIRRYKDTILVTGLVRGKEISDLVILDRNEDNQERMISASSAVLEQHESGESVIRLRLDSVFGHTVKSGDGNYDYFTADTMEYNILLSTFSFTVNNLTPREMSASAVYDDILEMRGQYSQRMAEYRKNLEQSLTAYRQAEENEKAEQEEIDRLKKDYERILANVPYDRTLQLYEIEFHKKLAIPFGCLAFMLFAFPAGLLPKKSGRWVGFGIGLLAAVLYWALLLAGQTVGLRFRISPFLAMWFPNFVIVFLGALIYTVRRHR